MRKALGILTMLLLTFGIAQGQKQVWNLSKNVLKTSNQISFAQASNGVWYFLASSSFAHDLKTYQFLPVYSLPCNLIPSSNAIINAPCWEIAVPDTEGSMTPIIGANVSYTTRIVAGFVLPPRSVWMHPGKFGYAIIGWQSPISGSVNVAGFFSDLDPTCGNGVLWYVDKGGQKLTSGTIPNGGTAQSFSLSGIPVSPGQVLYFLVGPNEDYHCDSTGVDVTVTEVK